MHGSGFQHYPGVMFGAAWDLAKHGAPEQVAGVQLTSAVAWAAACAAACALPPAHRSAKAWDTAEAVASAAWLKAWLLD